MAARSCSSGSGWRESTESSCIVASKVPDDFWATYSMSHRGSLPWCRIVLADLLPGSFDFSKPHGVLCGKSVEVPSWESGATASSFPFWVISLVQKASGGFREVAEVYARRTNGSRAENQAGGGSLTRLIAEAVGEATSNMQYLTYITNVSAYYKEQIIRLFTQTSYSGRLHTI